MRSFWNRKRPARRRRQGGPAGWKQAHREMARSRPPRLEPLEDRRLLAVFPVPTEPELPIGSLVYDSSVSGTVGDAIEDGFTIGLDHDQTVTLVVEAAATLQVSVEITDPTGGLIASTTSAAAGQDVVIQTVPTTDAGTYTVALAGAGGTTGEYSVRLILNAAV